MNDARHQRSRSRPPTPPMRARRPSRQGAWPIGRLIPMKCYDTLRGSPPTREKIAKTGDLDQTQTQAEMSNISLHKRTDNVDRSPRSCRRCSETAAADVATTLLTAVSFRVHQRDDPLDRIEVIDGR